MNTIVYLPPGRWKLLAGIGLPLLMVVIAAVTVVQRTSLNSRANSGSFTKVASGIFDINGVVPPGSTITLYERKAKSTASFVPFATGLRPNDQGGWGYIDGKTGETYEIMGNLVSNGTVVASAGPISVTVPAINQTLTFNVTSADAAATPSTAPVTISGHVHLDGYIPSGATLTLQRRKQGAPYYSIVDQNIVAKDGQEIIFTDVTAGQTYEVKALLYTANQRLIGTSEVLVVTAPAANEELHLNSTATPPATPTPTQQPTPTPKTAPLQSLTVVPTATNTPTPTPTPQIALSGTISLQGQAPLDSRIVVLERKSGAQSYQVAVDNITPQDGMSWKWTGATTGQLYDLIAVLKQKQSDGTDKDISSSNTLTVAAPASNEQLSINSGFVLPAPSSTVSISCNTYASSSQTWNAAVSFATVTGALSYWYEIGTTDGGIELANFTQNATNNTSQSFTYQLKNGVTYYARYAYSPFTNMSANDPSFSAFSSTTQIKCSQ
jgi:hypothetical protein